MRRRSASPSTRLEAQAEARRKYFDVCARPGAAVTTPRGGVRSNTGTESAALALAQKQRAARAALQQLRTEAAKRSAASGAVAGDDAPPVTAEAAEATTSTRARSGSSRRPRGQSILQRPEAAAAEATRGSGRPEALVYDESDGDDGGADNTLQRRQRVRDAVDPAAAKVDSLSRQMLGERRVQAAHRSVALTIGVDAIHAQSATANAETRFTAAYDRLAGVLEQISEHTEQVSRSRATREQLAAETARMLSELTAAAARDSAAASRSSSVANPAAALTHVSERATATSSRRGSTAVAVATTYSEPPRVSPPPTETKSDAARLSGGSHTSEPSSAAPPQQRRPRSRGDVDSPDGPDSTTLPNDTFAHLARRGTPGSDGAMPNDTFAGLSGWRQPGPADGSALENDTFAAYRTTPPTAQVEHRVLLSDDDDVPPVPSRQRVRDHNARGVAHREGASPEDLRLPSRGLASDRVGRQTSVESEHAFVDFTPEPDAGARAAHRKAREGTLDASL